MKFKHLNKETNEIMEKSKELKALWARENHFVYYDKAIKCLKRLEWIFEQAFIAQEDAFPSDLEGLSIIGDTGAGKTSIIDEFIKRHSSSYNSSYHDNYTKYCMLKDSDVGLKGLYTALLKPFNSAYIDAETIR